MINLTSNFAKEGILNEGGINHLCIEVEPSKKENINNIKKNLFMFVVDNSGSMGSSVDGLAYMNNIGNIPNKHNMFGISNYTTPLNYNYANTITNSRLDCAKSAMLDFIDMISNNDKIGVISFSTNATIVQEIIDVHNNKDMIKNNINKIALEGCTNISEPLQIAQEMMKSFKNEYNCKIILLSDGHANCGIQTKEGLSSLAEKISQDDITISSIGIGTDYDAHILGAISEKGYGNFYHIQDVTKIGDIFEKELLLNNSIVAIEASLELHIPSLIEIKDNLNAYSQTIENGKIKIKLGKINGKKKIIFEIVNNFATENIKFKIKFNYRCLENKLHTIEEDISLKVYNNVQELNNVKENKEIIEYVLELINQNNIMKAAESYERGDLKSIENSFGATMNSLDLLTATYSSGHDMSNSIRSASCDLKTSFISNSISANENKKLYETSYISRKN